MQVSVNLALVHLVPAVVACVLLVDRCSLQGSIASVVIAVGIVNILVDVICFLSCCMFFWVF